MTVQSRLVPNDMPEIGLRDGLLAEIERITQQLDCLRASLLTSAARTSDEMPMITATRIRRQLKARRARTQFFGPDLFADPAWDILLEAYAAHLTEQSTSVSALCNAAAVPSTTALRWIRKLEEVGLLERREDPADGRRCWIELTGAGSTMMRGYLEAISVTLPI